MSFSQFADQEGHNYLQTNTVEAACHLRAQDYGNFCEGSVSSPNSRPRATATFATTGRSQLHSKNACDQGWILWDRFCYLYSDKLVSFSEAENQCANLGAALASVHSDAENKFISYLARGVRTWIGALTFQQDFAWTDQSEKDYSNWSADCSDATDRPDCQEDQKAQQWYEAKTEDISGFICKKQTQEDVKGLIRMGHREAAEILLEIWGRQDIAINGSNHKTEQLGSQPTHDQIGNGVAGSWSEPFFVSLFKG